MAPQELEQVLSFKELLLTATKVVIITIGLLYLVHLPSEYNRYIENKARLLTVRIEAETGQGTGVIVKPGPNGLARVLTNHHICEGISVRPSSEEYYKLSLRKSLLLPVKGEVYFENRKKSKIIRILKNSNEQDLCLIEVNRKWKDKTGKDLDYANLARFRPQLGAKYFAVGFPGGEWKLVREGRFEGEYKEAFIKFLNPQEEKRVKELNKERWKLEIERMDILETSPNIFDMFMGMDISEDELKCPEEEEKSLKTPEQIEQEEKRLQEIHERIKEIKAEIKKVRKPKPRQEYIFTIPIRPGSSGSGIWNKEGRIVGMVWGISWAAGNTAVVVPLETIKKFLEPRLTW